MRKQHQHKGLFFPLDNNAEIAVVSYEPDDDVKAKKNVTLTTEVIPFYLEKFDAIAQENDGHLALGRVSFSQPFFATNSKFLSRHPAITYSNSILSIFFTLLFRSHSSHGPTFTLPVFWITSTIWRAPIWSQSIQIWSVSLKVSPIWNKSRPGWRRDHKLMFKHISSFVCVKQFFFSAFSIIHA